MRCTRFDDVRRLLWLVGKRNGLPRDLRQFLVKTAGKQMFVWETETLQQQRCEMLWVCLLGNPSWICGFVEQGVERFTPEEHGTQELKLTRVKLRRRYYQRLNYEWLWLDAADQALNMLHNVIAVVVD